METIDDETDHFGVHFVKINDKKVSKQYNIKSYPALTYFRNKEPIAYEGRSQIVFYYIRMMIQIAIVVACVAQF